MTFTYDQDGNTATRTEGSNTRAFDWSADNRLRSVARSADTVQYAYDPFGRLVRKQRRGTTERYFLWDGDQLLAELNDSATARIAEYAYQDGIDRPLAIATGDTAVELIRYFAQDEVGNVIGYFRDSTASPQFLYSDWGGVSATPAAKDTNRLYWKGLMWEGDSTVSLYYVRNRWYDWLSGRFISEDPIGLNGGINKYAFGLADPINSRDAFGMAVDTPRSRPNCRIEYKDPRCRTTLAPVRTVAEAMPCKEHNFGVCTDGFAFFPYPTHASLAESIGSGQGFGILSQVGKQGSPKYRAIYVNVTDGGPPARELAANVLLDDRPGVIALVTLTIAHEGIVSRRYNGKLLFSGQVYFSTMVVVDLGRIEFGNLSAVPFPSGGW